MMIACYFIDLFIILNRKHCAIRWSPQDSVFEVCALHPAGFYLDGEKLLPDEGFSEISPKSVIQVLFTHRDCSTSTSIFHSLDWQSNIHVQNPTNVSDDYYV